MMGAIRRLGGGKPKAKAVSDGDARHNVVVVDARSIQRRSIYLRAIHIHPGERILFNREYSSLMLQRQQQQQKNECRGFGDSKEWRRRWSCGGGIKRRLWMVLVVCVSNTLNSTVEILPSPTVR